MSETNLTPDQILAKTQEILKSVKIPSCPKVLLQINVEMQKEQVDLAPVADLVGKDVGLTARILKIANSPMFGSRVEIDSVKVALSRLGVRNFRNAVMAGGLRECMGERSPMMDRFWVHSEKVAIISQKVAQSLGVSVVDGAYLAGLFHDCGITLMLKKFPSYASHFEVALAAAPEAIKVEEAAYGTNHAVAGYMMAKTWSLPEAVADAVREHHITSSYTVTSLDCRMLAGVVNLAERIQLCHTAGNQTLFTNAEQEAKSLLFEGLKLGDASLGELVSEVTDWLASKAP